MVDGMRERTALEIADKLDYLTRSVMSIHNVPTLPKLCDCGEKAADMLRQQHAEIERLTALNSALTAKGNAFVIENARQAEKIGRLTAEKFRRFNNEECWIYQRNGENHLGTLTCPVVISPEALLSMQAEISILTAERDAATAAAVAAEREEHAAEIERLRAQVKRLRDALVGIVADDDVNGLRFTAAVLESIDCDDATISLAAVRALIDIRPEGSAGEEKR